MPGKRKKELSPSQRQYLQYSSKHEPKRRIVLNCIRAFFTGGLICTFGQALQLFFRTYFQFDEVTAGNPTAAVLIMLSVLLTGLGVYDHIAQWAGAGTAVPITGFANTIASASIEHRSEGYVLGVGANMFKLAGPVIAFGVFSAFIVAIVKLILGALGVI
jgi:stage V sporulation protein AC